MILNVLSLLIGVSVFFSLSYFPSIYWLLILTLLIPAYYYLNTYRWIFVIFIGFFLALIFSYLTLSSFLPLQLEGQDLTIKGKVYSIPVHKKHHLKFEFDVETLDFQGQTFLSPGKIRLSWYGYYPNLKLGEKWQLTVRLKRPHGMLNPGGFDYEKWLFVNRIRATGYVKGKGLNERLSIANHRFSVDQVRQNLSKVIASKIGNLPFSGVIEALAIGLRQNISSAQWDVFMGTGTNHLIAISGLHVGLVAGLMYFLAQRCWRFSSRLLLLCPPHKIASLLGMGAAFYYAALAGFSIPTLRALTMIFVVMGHVFLAKEINPIRVLLFALLVILLMDPLAVLQAGFWLSFAAVGIILYCMRFRLLNTGLWWKMGRVHLVVAFGLTPFLLVLFQKIPLIAPFANFVAVPVVSLIVVPLVLIGVSLLEWLPTLGESCLRLANYSLELLWPYLKALNAQTWSHWNQHTPGVGAMIFGLVGTMVILMPRGLPGRWIGFLCLLPLFINDPEKPKKGEIWLTLLDVGQGLSTVVQTSNFVLVYDTGAKFSDDFDMGAAVVVPFLREQGIRKIDLLVIGHGDNDHMGGYQSLVKAIPVTQVISSVPEKITDRLAMPCSDKQVWINDEVKFDVLYPVTGGKKRGNNASCVLKISNGFGNILLTGDIEKSAERFLLKQYTAAELKSDIIVVPHHGSKSSSTLPFIQAVQPDIALFPVGYRNRYHFPKAEIVDRYAQQGVAMYNTGTQGAISIVIDNIVHEPVSYRSQARRIWHN